MASESQPNEKPLPLYDNDLQRPSSEAPQRDLPPELRPVFTALRDLCLGIPDALENVRHDGAHWRWVWAYERDGYTLCVIHPLKSAVDLSFPLPQRYEAGYSKEGLDPALATAVSKGPTAAKVRYARVNVPDVKASGRLFEGVRIKLQLMSEEGKNS